jgi:hypothetical protein
MAIGVTPVITTGVIVITDAICTDPNPAGRCLFLIDEALAENHLSRDAREWRARSPDLLLGLQVQSFDRDQRRSMA